MKSAAALALCVLVAGFSPAARATGDCPGPRPGWRTVREGTPHLAVINRLRIAAGNRLEWNGTPITRETARQYLGIVATMNPLPFTILVPDAGADCAFLEAIRDDLAAALPCGEGACGEGRGRWGYGEGPPPPAPGSQAERDRAAALAEIEAAADAAAAKVEPK